MVCHAEPPAKHLAIDTQILRFTQNDSFFDELQTNSIFRQVLVSYIKIKHFTLNTNKYGSCRNNRICKSRCEGRSR